MKRQLNGRLLGVWLILLASSLTSYLFPFASLASSNLENGAHGKSPCNLCHFTRGEEAGFSGLARDGKCRSCHQSGRILGIQELGFHNNPSLNCARCHSFHDPDALKVPGGRMSLADLQEAGTDHCRSCHGAEGRLADLSDSHRVASNLYHGDLGSLKNLSPSEGCLLCHSVDSTSNWRNAFPEAVVAFNRHRSHPLGIPNRATRAANAFFVRLDQEPKLVLYHGRIECQTCHLMAVRNKDLLVPFPEKQDLCLGCHKRTGSEKVRPSILATKMAGF